MSFIGIYIEGYHDLEIIKLLESPDDPLLYLFYIVHPQLTATLYSNNMGQQSSLDMTTGVFKAPYDPEDITNKTAIKAAEDLIEEIANNDLEPWIIIIKNAPIIIL